MPFIDRVNFLYTGLVQLMMELLQIIPFLPVMLGMRLILPLLGIKLIQLG